MDKDRINDDLAEYKNHCTGMLSFRERRFVNCGISGPISIKYVFFCNIFVYWYIMFVGGFAKL
jgi:hypothetical protein